MIIDLQAYKHSNMIWTVDINYTKLQSHFLDSNPYAKLISFFFRLIQKSVLSDKNNYIVYFYGCVRIIKRFNLRKCHLKMATKMIQIWNLKIKHQLLSWTEIDFKINIIHQKMASWAFWDKKLNYLLWHSSGFDMPQCPTKGFRLYQPNWTTL